MLGGQGINTGKFSALEQFFTGARPPQLEINAPSESGVRLLLRVYSTAKLYNRWTRLITHISTNFP